MTTPALDDETISHGLTRRVGDAYALATPLEEVLWGGQGAADIDRYTSRLLLGKTNV